ncbi:MAG: hypothetical protein ACOC2L_02390 [Candidatus Sumerlaeota bacterium]
MQYCLKLADARPVIDASPHHTRMAACYRDKAGGWHAFVDHIDISLGTPQSWLAEIRYYFSEDGFHFEDRGIVVSRGETGADDDYGAASPLVFATEESIYLFYCGRHLADADAHEKGGIHSSQGLELCLMACVARADENGAPIEPFEKRGVVCRGAESIAPIYLKQCVEPESVVESEGQYWLFHSGIGERDGKPVKKAEFRRKLELPSLQVGPAEQIVAPEGGGELCRYFFHDGQWQIFYRHFQNPKGEGCYRHYRSENMIDWECVDTQLFRSHTPHPDSAADIGIVYGLNGELADPATILATGFEDGLLKIWRYNLMECKPLKL